MESIKYKSVTGKYIQSKVYSLSSGLISVMIFRSWGGSEIDSGALGVHFGTQNGHVLTSWVDFDPSWVLERHFDRSCQVLGSILGGF